MEEETFSQYLKERYRNQIDWYDKKAGESQARYRLLQWFVIVLAPVTPVLIELDIDFATNDVFGRLAIVTSVVVAILTSGLKTFKYQENWINYRTTCETLRKEKYFYDASVGDYRGAEDKEALFVDRVESLISRENTMWVSSQKTKSKSSQDQGRAKAENGTA